VKRLRWKLKRRITMGKMKRKETGKMKGKGRGKPRNQRLG
jgi:hypothetical protein